MQESTYRIRGEVSKGHTIMNNILGWQPGRPERGDVGFRRQPD